jgi:transposase-like protein
MMTDTTSGRTARDQVRTSHLEKTSLARQQKGSDLSAHTVTVWQAAGRLGVSPQSVTRWIRSGRLACTGRQGLARSQKATYLITTQLLADFERDWQRLGPPERALPVLRPLNSAEPFTQRECLAIIHDLRWPPLGLVPCPDCGATDHYPAPGRRHAFLVCAVCEKKYSQLHSTLFHRTSLPLPYWFHVIYHTDPRRCRYGYGAALARRLGMSMATIHRLMRRIKAARRDPAHGPFVRALEGRLDTLAARTNAVDLAVYDPLPRGNQQQSPAELPDAPRDDPLLDWYLSRVLWAHPSRLSPGSSR